MQILTEIYERHIRSEDFAEREKGLEDAEEAHLDGDITQEQWEFLVRLYSDLTGDKAILETYL